MTDERIGKPWKVNTSEAGHFWEIINLETGRKVKIGPVGGKRTNFYDKAVNEAERRNALELTRKEGTP